MNAQPRAVSQPRVFLGLNEIAGYYAHLTRGFEELGVRCDYVDLSAHAFEYAPQSTRPLIKLLRRLALARSRAHGARRSAMTTAHATLRMLLLVKVMIRNDIFIFGYQSTFFGFRELRLLRLFGKKVVYVFHGSDSRPPYIDGAAFQVATDWTARHCVAATRRQKRVIGRIERHADLIVSHPLHSQLHERPFVVSARLGIPFAPPPHYELSTPDWSGGVRVVHSPSAPEAKGTSEIRCAIDNLRRRGHTIDYVELIGQPNEVVLAHLASCDFVIDQLYSDFPLAGFATEAAYFGKPAIVGGYCGEYFDEFLPPAIRPPSLFVHPTELEASIEKLLTDGTERARLGEEAQDFVRRHCDPAAVARRYLDVFAGPPPDDWMYDPARIRYLHGSGLSESRARALVAAVVEVGGSQALALDNKIELKTRLLLFARDANAP